jgi:hypothetical protein
VVRFELGVVVLGVADDEPLREGRHGQLAEPRVEPHLRPVRLGELWQPRLPCRQASVEAGEQDAQRERPLALDHPDPDRVLGRAPERDRGGAVPIEDALELAEPEGEHLDDVGEDLARAPRRLGLGPECGRQRPWLAGRDARRQALVGVASRGDPSGSEAGGSVDGHGGQCGTPGVRLAHCPRLPQGRPIPHAAEMRR